jgi:hypothetical protein
MAYVICFGIIGWILVGIFAQVWEESAEIAREEQRKQDFRELNRWKQKAAHPILHIKDTDGKESTEFVLRR